MNTGSDWPRAVGLTLVLLLGGVVYFLWPANSSISPASSSQSVATQTPIQNPAPGIASPAQPTDTTYSHLAQVSSSSAPTYQYNAQGQMQVIIYPDGSTYTYQYNPEGDKIRETSSRTGKTWSYVYDQNNDPLAVIDPEGHVIHTASPANTPNSPTAP